MLTYVLTALQDETNTTTATTTPTSTTTSPLSSDRTTTTFRRLLSHDTAASNNNHCPISTFRKDDDDEEEDEVEEEDSPIIDEQEECPTTTIETDLLFPDFHPESKKDDKSLPLAPCTLNNVPATNNTPISSSLPWEERIEQEIKAAQQRSANATSRIIAPPTPPVVAVSSPTRGSVDGLASTPPNTNAANGSLILHDESMNSVTSYELLQQHVQLGDVIAKERFLSFDSKEDIDFAETRGLLIAQRLQRQSSQTIIFEKEEETSPGLHISPHPLNTSHHGLDDSFVSMESILDNEKDDETMSPLVLSPRQPDPTLQEVEPVDSESTHAVRNLSHVYSTTVSLNDKGASARVFIEEKKVSYDEAEDLKDCLSATESEVASIDGLPKGLQTQWKKAPEQMMKNLDGIQGVRRRRRTPTATSPTLPPQQQKGKQHHRRPSIADLQEEDCSQLLGPFFEPCFQFSFWGDCAEEKTDDEGGDGKRKSNKSKLSWKDQHDVPLAILDCSNLIHHREDRVPPPVPTSLVRVASDHPSPSYAETILPTEVDPRMQDWIAGQFAFRTRPPKDGSFHLGKSRTVVVHEINRGNWTWCTEWSPDGALMAVATENHHLAIVDTTSSTVWRVRHDRKVRGPMKNDTTHSIRAIAWGHSYIAIGGTGNAVSILAPRDPYPILHTIKGTGFVGCLGWRLESNILAIGSRLDVAMIVRILTTHKEDNGSTDGTSQKGTPVRMDSQVLHRIKYNYWVNSISFSPDGSFLAVGDSGGIVSVYDYEETSEKKEVETNMIAWFKRKSALLSIDWSPDGKWLYAGGEDRSVTVIDTTFWEIVHRIGRDRWVQCIAASNGGSHVAVGGVSSEISLLDVEKGWDSVMGIELKGLVPLSAKWHPKDQYLAVTGQDTSILVVETTNARHVKGHHLHSVSPVLAIEFSPDGRMAIIGNAAGVVTFYSLSGTTFITAYELVVPLDTKVCTEWSRNGMFVVIGAMDNLTVVGRRRNKRQSKKCPPNASGFSVKKVLRDIGETNSVSIDWQSHYVAVSGICTMILDVRADFSIVREWGDGPYYANAWSPDGRWLAMVGQGKSLTIYDTSSRQVDEWRAIFSMKCDFVGHALAWGPVMVGGLLYLAYGGDSNEVFIMEIRTHEGTWETVLRIARDDTINTLDWSTDGLLAAGIGNGTVSLIDLAYLQSGMAVNEMDYNWQRQALTCFTEIRRNRGKNSIRSLRWLPAAPGSDRLLAIGGTDGEVEILDLTERQRCRGYVRSKKRP